MYEARRQRSSWARIKLSIVRKFMSISLFQDRSNFIFVVHHSLRINKFISSFAILFSRFNKNWIALLSYYLYFAIYNKNLGFKSFSRRWPDYLIPPAAFQLHQRFYRFVSLWLRFLCLGSVSFTRRLISYDINFKSQHLFLNFFYKS